MKKYINPVCKVMTLSLKQSMLDDKFGNTSAIPVVPGTNEDQVSIEVDDMFTNKSVWD